MLCVSLFVGAAASAFTARPMIAHAVAQRAVAPTMTGAFLALEALEPAVQSYVNIWVPLFEGAKAAGIAPEFLLHWGHGAAMSTVLFAMGGYGAYLGWQTRFGNGDVEYPLPSATRRANSTRSSWER